MMVVNGRVLHTGVCMYMWNWVRSYLIECARVRVYVCVRMRLCVLCVRVCLSRGLGV